MTRMQDAYLALKGLIAVILVLAVVHWLEKNAFELQAGQSLFALGFLLLSGTAAGRIAALFGLPRLTGYIFAGILSGPSGFEIFGDKAVEEIKLVNSLALALIGLQAGAEFTKEMLKNNFRSLFWACFSHSVVIMLGSIGVFYFIYPYLGLDGAYTTASVLGLGAVWGAVSVSKSPAAVVAILGEMRSKGPLSDHALGIVVLLDVIVLVIFSVSLIIARSLTDPGLTLSVGELSHLGVELMASVAAGTTFGLLIILYFWLVDRERLLFLLAAAYGVTAFTRFFNYETMLVFVVAGFVVTNFSRKAKEMIHTVESASATVMIVFFATAGASLRLADLKEIWIIVIILVLARAILTWLAAQAGHHLAADPPVVRKYGFTPFIAQAGLSLGLAVIMQERLPGVGGTLAAMTISVVTINQIIGPILFKWGLQRAGEIKVENV